MQQLGVYRQLGEYRRLALILIHPITSVSVLVDTVIRKLVAGHRWIRLLLTGVVLAGPLWNRFYLSNADNQLSAHRPSQQRIHLDQPSRLAGLRRVG